MPADDVYLAMVALEDPDVVERAAAGDWGALDDLDLTEDERALVADLIDEEASDVEGFAGGAMFAATSYVSGNVSRSVLARHNPVTFRFGKAGWACGGSCEGKCKGHQPGPALGR